MLESIDLTLVLGEDLRFRVRVGVSLSCGRSVHNATHVRS